MPQTTLKHNHTTTTIKLGANGLKLTTTELAKVNYWKNGVSKGEINVPLQGIRLKPVGPAPIQTTLYKFEYKDSHSGGVVTISY